MKLNPATGLSLVDYFTPYNWSDLNVGDQDLGVSGPLLIPNTNLILSGSKTGYLYLMNTGNLGQLAFGDTQIVQTFVAVVAHLHGAPVYYNSPSLGPLVYTWSEDDVLKAYHFNGVDFDTTPISQSTNGAPSGMPGGILSVSANGNVSGTGILWAALPSTSDAEFTVVAGVLRAFDASNLSHELWNSLQVSADDVGNFAKFCPPTIANGKVYLATFSNRLNVYGLGTGFTVFGTPTSQSVAQGSGTTYTMTVTATGGFTGSTALSIAGLPSGATGTFSPATITVGSGTSTLSVTTAASTPVGTSTLTITGTSGTLTSTTTITLIVTSTGGGGGSGSLSGTVSTPTSTQNLSTLGSADWAHWGLSGVSSYDHKAGITPLISNYTMVGGTVESYSDHPIGFTWTGGTPTASATNTTTGIYVSGQGNGFQITAPADGTQRTLTVYVGVWDAQGKMTAYLSDNSAPAYSDTTLNSTSGSLAGMYTFAYKSSSPGQTLNISYTQNNGGAGNVTLQGAALAIASVADFTISGAPSSQSVVQGSGATYTVNVNSVNGFIGSTALSIAGLPSGATGTFSPPTITGGSGTSTLTITTAASTPVSTPTLTITGTSGTLTHTASTSLVVTAAAGFTISGIPPSQSVVQGNSTTYTMTVTATGGFAGNTALSIAGLPSGATGTFSPATITGGSGTSTLTITTAASTPVSTSTLTITGTSGALTSTTTMTLTVTSAGGGGSGSLSGTVSTPTTTQVLSTLGTADWAHWGLSGVTSYDHKADITPLISNYTMVGSGQVALYPDHPIGFTWTGGTPTASATNTTTGIYVSGQGNGFQIIVPADGTQRTLTVYVGVWESQGKMVAHLSDGSATDYTDTTLNSTTGPLAGMYTFVYKSNTPGQTLQITYTQNNGGIGNVTMQGAALAIASGADFTISGAPSSQSVVQGSGTTYTVTVNPVNGFTGNAALSIAGLPSGASGTFNPATITGGSGTSTLTVTTAATTPVSTSTLTITGISGVLTHMASTSLVVTSPADFTISAAPASRSVVQGSGTTYTTTVTAIGNFTGNAALSIAGLPSGAIGTFNPATITAGSGTSTLTITTAASTPVSTSTLTITGTSGALTHTASTSLVVTAAADFTISGIPATQSVAQGSGTTYTMTVNPLNGFTGNTVLSIAGLPSGATATFNPATITAGSGTSTLNITTIASTPVSTSTLTVTGTSGAITHTAIVNLTVTSAGAGSGSLIGTVGNPTTTQVLSTLGTADWAHWGLTGPTSYDHKAGITALISNYTMVGGGLVDSYSDHPIAFSWTGGTPTASATNTATGIYVAGQNNGFKITAPADGTQRTLIVYVGVWRAQGKMVAHLSDSSATDYTDTSLNDPTDPVAGMYTFVYKSNSPGQTLQITYTQNSSGGGNVTMQGAALH
jgi:hypothetical protein